MNSKFKIFVFVVFYSICLNSTSIFGQFGPDINIAPLLFDEQVPYGSSSVKKLYIQNTGTDRLDWYVITSFDSTSLKTYSTSGAATTHIFATGERNQNAVLTITLNGDFGSSYEYAELLIEGTNLGKIEDNNVYDGADIVVKYDLSGSDIANWTSDGLLAITIDNCSDVDSYSGSRTHKVRLEMEGFANWITLSKSSGTVSGSDSDSLELTFKTDNLDAEIFKENIVFYSNDVDEPEVTVNVTMTVIGPSISANPTSISKQLDEGQQQTNNLTILNSGIGLLEYDILLSSQTPNFLTINADINKRMSVEDAINSIVKRSGILEHEIQLLTIELKTKQENRIILKHAEEIAAVKYLKKSGLNVAILGADNTYNLQDVQQKLSSTNVFGSITIINVASITPTLTELLAFDGVLVFNSHSYSNKVSLGNNLADYVDSGGGVVCAAFEVTGNSSRHLTGRWETGQYFVIKRSSNIYYDHATLGIISAPNHPIMRGVNLFDGGYYSYRPSTTNLTVGSTIIATWSDGKPLVAEKKVGNVFRVDLGFYPVSSDRDQSFWQVNTDGALLMANAILYASGGSVPWCEVDPDNGSITQNNSQDISVTFDASDIDQGTHTGNLVIESNDPDNPELIVPLTLTVTDVTPPGVINDLKNESIAAGFAIFSWTAPGDNGTQGIAESYDLRYSPEQITESNWQSAIPVSDTLPVPSFPEAFQTVRITNLTPETTYYFALKTKDEANLYSALSNVVMVKTTPVVEALIYLPFEETSGEIALNYQGDENFDGILNSFDNLDGRDVAINSGWTQYGYKGGALKLDGNNDYVSIPDYGGSPLQVSSGLTLKLAIKPRNDIIPTGNSGFINIISKIKNYSGYNLRFNKENGRLRFMIYFGSNNVGIYETTKSSWAGGFWYEIIVTYEYSKSSDNIKIYINGLPDASYTESRVLTTNDEPILIGGGSGYSSPRFPGIIDELIIHNKAIDPFRDAEITVTRPNGGEQFTWDNQKDTEEEITWTSNNTTGIVKIELSRNNGTSWETITESTEDDGSYLCVP